VLLALRILQQVCPQRPANERHHRAIVDWWLVGLAGKSWLGSSL
jgi:hypothetical protein